MSEGIKARPVGRVLRVLAGVALTAEAARHMFESSTSLVLSVAGSAVGLVVFYAAVHVLVSRFVPTINCWVGAALAITPVVLVFVFGGAPGQLGSLLFVGVSLVLSGIRADGGCEVMTLPGMLLGSRTHLACLFFSPIDWAEAKLSRANQ